MSNYCKNEPDKFGPCRGSTQEIRISKKTKQ